MTVALKSISAQRKQPSGHANRIKASKKRGGENVGWHRITDNLDDVLKKLAINPDMGIPLLRWVYFGHLTKTQGAAGRRYADIVQAFDRFYTDTNGRTPKAQAYQGGASGKDMELERRQADGTLEEYELSARKAMRRYTKLNGIVSSFHGAREALDSLCVLHIEPPADQRPLCAAVLGLIATAFNLDGRKGGRR